MKKILRLFVAFLTTIIMTGYATAQVSISIRIGPPPLPVYEQPYPPGDGYIWIPGYWAYDDDGYYWVPGMWVWPPEIGLLWTPGYWDFIDGYYGWHPGYWGRRVGYYGGINYGFGYGGRGYCGGEWRGRAFRYNTAITRVNTTIVYNTYINRTVVNNNTIVNNNRASFHGRGGVAVKPTRQELAATRETHIKPTTVQVAHQNSAKADRRQFALASNGRPAKLVEEPTKSNNLDAPAKNGAVPNANIQRKEVIQKQQREQQINANNQRLESLQKQQREQQVNANNQRKEPIQRQQREQQVNANNQRKEPIQRQQREQQVNASNQRKESLQKQQREQQVNINNQRREAAIERQHAQQASADNQRKEAIQNQRREQHVNNQRKQVQIQPRAKRPGNKDK